MPAFLSASLIYFCVCRMLPLTEARGGVTGDRSPANFSVFNIMPILPMGVEWKESTSNGPRPLQSSRPGAALECFRVLLSARELAHWSGIRCSVELSWRRASVTTDGKRGWQGPARLGRIRSQGSTHALYGHSWHEPKRPILKTADVRHVSADGESSDS